MRRVDNQPFGILHWRAIFVRSFVALGGLWTVVELVTSFAGNLLEEEDRLYAMGALFLLSIVIGVSWVWQANRQTSFRLRGTQTELTIRFGDAFTYVSNLVVPVNAYFDHAVGERLPVSEKSMHGQLITMMTHEAFRKQVDAALRSVDSSKIAAMEPDRQVGQAAPTTRYELGTVAVIDHEGSRYNLVAVANTETKDHVATTTLPEIFMALSSAWETVARTGDDRKLTLPLIGGGFAKVRVDPEHLLDILIASIVEYTLREGRIASEIEIVLPVKYRQRIRCYNVKAEWS